MLGGVRVGGGCAWSRDVYDAPPPPPPPLPLLLPLQPLPPEGINLRIGGQGQGLLQPLHLAGLYNRISFCLAPKINPVGPNGVVCALGIGQWLESGRDNVPLQ